MQKALLFLLYIGTKIQWKQDTITILEEAFAISYPDIFYIPISKWFSSIGW